MKRTLVWSVLLSNGEPVTPPFTQSFYDVESDQEYFSNIQSAGEAAKRIVVSEYDPYPSIHPRWVDAGE